MRARLLLLGALLAGGVGIALALPQAASPAAPPRPLLWKVSDGNNALYLLGAFHALKSSDYPLAPSVDAAFADAKTVVFEMSAEEMSSPEVGMLMLRAATYPEGQDLQHSIDARTWQRLEAYAASRKQPVATFQRFEPWFAALLVSLSEMQRIGYDPKQGLDQQMLARAVQANKRTMGLETGASQIAVLDGMSPDEQKQSLSESLDDTEHSAQHMDELHALWRNGDEAGLTKLLTIEFKHDYPALYRRIDVERNNAWVPKLAALLDGPSTDDTLVVVGSMHLLGPDGVVSQLKKRGYRVERL